MSAFIILTLVLTPAGAIREEREIKRPAGLIGRTRIIQTFRGHNCLHKRPKGGWRSLETNAVIWQTRGIQDKHAVSVLAMEMCEC